MSELEVVHGVNCGPGGEGLCVRCAGFTGNEGIETRFEPGNDLSVRHGAYSQLRIGSRADEIVDVLRGLVARYRQNDEPMVALLAVTWARIEAASAALDGCDDPSRLRSLESDLRGWVNTARRLLVDLGMTPTARARMGLDVAQTARALNIQDLAAAALVLDDRDVEDGEQP